MFFMLVFKTGLLMLDKEKLVPFAFFNISFTITSLILFSILSVFFINSLNCFCISEPRVSLSKSKSNGMTLPFLDFTDS